METIKKVRIIVSIVLFFIMLLASVFVYQNRANIFMSTYEITYPDRCVEVFENDVLISEECVAGRMKLDKIKKCQEETFGVKNCESIVNMPELNGSWMEKYIEDNNIMGNLTNVT